MGRPMLSVIIPCYNAESYLEEAVCSCIGQAFSDLEVLVIDDASTDASREIADKCAAYDPRVRVITLETNSGASAARNRGILEAAGEYITFLDADDIFAPHLFEKIAPECEKKPDVVVWGAYEEYRNASEQITKKVRVYCPQSDLKTAEDVRSRVMLLEKRSLYGYLWNKAYRAELIKRHTIPKQPFNEDEMFNIEVFCEVEHAILLNYFGTYYRIRPSGSLTHRELPTYYPVAMKRIAGLMLQHRTWDLYTEENRRDIANLYIRYIASALERNFHKAMDMDTTARRRFLQRVYASRLYRELAPWAEPSNPVLKLLAEALRKKDTERCLLIGRGLYLIKTGLPAVFDSGKRG